MIKNYKELNNLLLDFIPERFTITWCKPDFNSKGITAFRFRIALQDFLFDVIYRQYTRNKNFKQRLQ